MDQVVDLYKYNAWANEQIINHLKTRSPDTYQKEVKSVFSSVSKVLSHIYLVEHTWLDILEGKSMKEAMETSYQLQGKIEKLTLLEIENEYNMLSKRFNSFLEKHDCLDKKIILDNPYADVREINLSGMVLHVVNHGTYHRGNISAMLHQSGDSSIMTDYANYWYTKPAYQEKK